MVYNLSNVLDAQNAETRLQQLKKKGCVIELTEKKPKRSIKQNAYLHLILGYFATQTGDTPEWVKQQYFKKLCNPDIFIWRETRQIPRDSEVHKELGRTHHRPDEYGYRKV